jgi:hypothetical protein
MQTPADMLPLVNEGSASELNDQDANKRTLKPISGEKNDETRNYSHNSGCDNIRDPYGRLLLHHRSRRMLRRQEY